MATIDPTLFRNVLGRFPSGVTVITAIDPESGAPVGLAANSFSSLSMDPALVLFCAAHTSSTWPRIKAAGRFCVNVLAESQEGLSRQFAGKGDKYAGVAWHPAAATGSPSLEGALAFMDCEIDAMHDAGDHVIVVGRVLEMGYADDTDPLVYYRGSYGRFDTGPQE